MAQAKVTIESLTQMAEILRQSADDILGTKEQMDNELYNIPWDDPIGLTFISKYEEDFKPLKEKLIPNINNYIQYMKDEGVIVSEYSGESIGGLGVTGAAGAGAAGAGAAGAGAAKSHIPDNPITEEPNPKGENTFRDTDFEDSISDMDEEDLRYMEYTYKDYGDLAGIADYSYRDGAPCPVGWEDLGQQDPNIQRIIDDIGNNGGDSSGLKFSVLKKAGEDRYVISFAGTDFPKDWMNLSQDKEILKDGWTDVHGMFSPDEKQIQMAKDAVQRLCKEGGIPSEKMEFTGHSLGGRLAAEMSVQYERPATTFNAAGVSEPTRTRYESMVAHSRNYLGVRNVVTEHDFLTKSQSGLSWGKKNPYIAVIPNKLNPSGVIFNRDYRALGGTLVLADGKSGISGEAHRIGFVKNLLDQRHKAIMNRLGE